MVGDTAFGEMRALMVASQLRTVGIARPSVLDAMGAVPRERFVPAAFAPVAYHDRMIPLGRDRFLNAPATIGQLLDEADVRRGERVLLVGAGSGYTAAVLVALGAEVVGVESDGRLLAQARERVPEATLVEAELAAGAPAEGPYDVIVIDGAVETVPPALVAQLQPQGRLVAGQLDRGVTRLALGRRAGPGFALHAFADAEVAALPGFVAPPVFSF